MDGYHINIEQETIKNEYYRKVLYTTKQNQIVLMSIQPKDDIPLEIHPNITQFIRIEKGHGKAYINNKVYNLFDGIAIDIPAGASHRIVNTSDTDTLKLYTIYSPPEHKPGLKQLTKPKKLKQKEYLLNLIKFLLL